MMEQDAIVHEVTYPQSPERVWQALVDSDQLTVWLMPTDFVPELGGRFTVWCPSHGRVQGEVLELDPPRRLSCRWLGVFGDTVVTFELTPSGTGTKLRLEHRGWNPSEPADRQGFDAGWQQMLADGLRSVLAGTDAHRVQWSPATGPRCG